MSIDVLLKDLSAVEGLGYRIIETGHETIDAFRCLDAFNANKVGADVAAPYVRHIIGEVAGVMPDIEEKYVGEYVRKGVLAALGGSCGGVGLLGGWGVATYAGAGMMATGVAVPAALAGLLVGIYVFDNQRTTHEKNVAHLHDIAARCTQAYSADDSVFEQALKKDRNALASVLEDAKRNANPIKHNDYFFIDPVSGPSAP